MAARSWDRAAWQVAASDSEPFEITTKTGATWALRALMVAGVEGLHPIDTGGGRWAHLVERLRDIGLPIDDLPDNEEGRRGYRLAATVRPFRGAE